MNRRPTTRMVYRNEHRLFSLETTVHENKAEEKKLERACTMESKDCILSGKNTFIDTLCELQVSEALWEYFSKRRES